MDAIEIAHRDHGPFGDRGQGRGIADNGKGGRHFRILQQGRLGAGP
jgi:hypothetical protein